MVWLDSLIELFPALADAWQFIRPRSKCPQCCSYKVRLTSEKLLSMHMFNHHRSNLNTTVLLVYGVNYRCYQCQATWYKTITKSR